MNIMNKHPVFYTQSDFLNMPSHEGADTNSYLLEMSQRRFSEIYEAKSNYSMDVMANKMSEVAGNINDSALQSTISNNLADFTSNLNDIIKFTGYGADYEMSPERSEKLKKMTDSLQAVHDISRDKADEYDSSLSSDDLISLERIASMANMTYLVILGVKPSLENNPSFPVNKDYSPVSDVEDSTSLHVDEATDVTNENRRVLINELTTVFMQCVVTTIAYFSVYSFDTLLILSALSDT